MIMRFLSIIFKNENEFFEFVQKFEFNYLNFKPVHSKKVFSQFIKLFFGIISRKKLIFR